MNKRALIIHELRSHAPYTALGSIGGVLLLLGWLATGAGANASAQFFAILHPLHVLLSAQATVMTFRRAGGAGFWRTALIGAVGGVAIGTVSDSLIPFLGEWLLGLPHAAPHIGFIEEWGFVLLAAALGVGLGTWRGHSRVPHGLHVWISTGASLFHVAMAMSGVPSIAVLGGIAAFIFLSVWVPCCTSDIVFPLLFVSNPKVETCTCGTNHGHRFSQMEKRQTATLAKTAKPPSAF